MSIKVVALKLVILSHQSLVQQTTKPGGEVCSLKWVGTKCATTLHNQPILFTSFPLFLGVLLLAIEIHTCDINYVSGRTSQFTSSTRF